MKKHQLQKELDLAIQSLASYVERSDTLVILVPPTVHEDRIRSDTNRKVVTCYRTWRQRGLCLLELFACFFSRRKTHPILLIRSATETPVWISSHECVKLAVGEAKFTCCETNHRGHDGKSSMECTRHVARDVLKTLIRAKISDLCEQNEIVLARWFIVLEHVWTRGLGESTNDTGKLSIDRFRTILGWSSKKDGTWIDRKGVGILTYAACSNNTEVLRDYLREINGNVELIDARIPKSGFVYVGIPGSCTALIGAMVFGSPRMVEILLQEGASPYITDKNGNDPLMCACVYGRLSNVTFWLDRFTHWDINKLRGKFGANVMSCAVMMGPGRFELVKYLISKGATVDGMSFNGTSTLTAACANEDADPGVIQILLEHSRDGKMINRRIRARTAKWKGIYLVSKLAVRTGLTQSTLMKRFAERQGRTALHYAARRGDLDLVELLLSHGAGPAFYQPNVKQAVGGPSIIAMTNKHNAITFKIDGVCKDASIIFWAPSTFVLINSKGLYSAAGTCFKAAACIT